MATFSLLPHPDRASTANLAIIVDVERSGTALVFWFWVRDTSGTIRMPEHGNGGRTDGLWRHTCFEVFVRPVGQDGYVELNFSPWGEWAAYDFDGYRRGMRDRVGPSAPWAGYKGSRDDGFHGWSFGADALPGSADDWQLGLSAVIEEIDGTKSYWALAHAPGPPDFHHPACFVATLPAPVRP